MTWSGDLGTTRSSESRTQPALGRWGTHPGAWIGSQGPGSPQPLSVGVRGRGLPTDSEPPPSSAL